MAVADPYDPFPALVPSRRTPPAAPSTPPPPAALRALLHTRLAVVMTDGRTLVGHLLAIDSSASLLLSSVREHRALEDTPRGENIARFYPFSRNSDDLQRDQARNCERGRERERELASVLIPMKHVVSVTMSSDDATAWGRYSGVEFRDGVAVAA